MAILTISRAYGSGGREIGRAVAARLGYAYEDRVTLLADLRAADPSWERFGSSYRGYVALLQRHLLEAAAAGRVVIVGRGGSFLLAGVPTALHVRIVAPLASRIERIMRREHADHDSVRALIERIDRERAGFIRAVYHRSWDDPAGYDLTYDTSLLEQTAIADDIVARLASRDQADHEAAQRLLAVRLVAARARAALFTDRQLQLPTLEVLVEGPGLLVRGVIHRPEEKLRVQEIVLAHAEERPVRFDLRYR